MYGEHQILEYVTLLNLSSVTRVLCNVWRVTRQFRIMCVSSASVTYCFVTLLFPCYPGHATLVTLCSLCLNQTNTSPHSLFGFTDNAASWLRVVKIKKNKTKSTTEHTTKFKNRNCSFMHDLKMYLIVMNFKHFINF